MSSTEVFILVTIIATTIHYCTMWGSYLEKKMILDDHIDMASKRKKVTITIIKSNLIANSISFLECRSDRTFETSQDDRSDTFIL